MHDLAHLLQGTHEDAMPHSRRIETRQEKSAAGAKEYAQMALQNAPLRKKTISPWSASSTTPTMSPCVKLAALVATRRPPTRTTPLLRAQAMHGSHSPPMRRQRSASTANAWKPFNANATPMQCPCLQTKTCKHTMKFSGLPSAGMAKVQNVSCLGVMGTSILSWLRYGKAFGVKAHESTQCTGYLMTEDYPFAIFNFFVAVD